MITEDYHTSDHESGETPTHGLDFLSANIESVKKDIQLYRV